MLKLLSLPLMLSVVTACSLGSSTLSKKEAQRLITEAVMRGPNAGVHMARIAYGTRDPKRQPLEEWFHQHGFMETREGGVHLLREMVSVVGTGPSGMIEEQNTMLTEDYGEFRLRAPLTREEIVVSSVSTDGKKAKAFWKPVQVKYEPIYSYVCKENRSLSINNSDICLDAERTGPDIYATFEKSDDGEWRLISAMGAAGM